MDIDIQDGKTYYYRVRASDEVGNFGGASGVVAKEAIGRYIEAPKIVSSPVASASFDQATISWVTSRESTSFVYYGKSPTNLDQSKGSLDIVASHQVVINGLEPRTVYYFKVQSFDIERDYSLDKSFSDVFTFRTSDSGNFGC